MEKIKNINLREEYYKDIYNMKPKWWMHWGISVVFIILSIILLLGYYIKYPDVIKSEFRLSTNKPSITLPISHGYQIKKIFKNNNARVNTNDHLILFENDSKYQDVILLEKELKMFSFNKDSILLFFDKYLNENLQLGSTIEHNWISFSNKLLEYYKIKKLNFYKYQIAFIKNELSKQYQLKNHYLQLIVTDKKQGVLLEKKIETDSILFSKGIISEMNFNIKRSNSLETIKNLQQNKLALKRINLEIARLQNTINNFGSDEIENLLSTKLGIRKSLNKLLSSIELWKRKNLLISPISGKLSFIQDINPGGFYEGNVLTISPLGKNYYASIQIPLVGAGKVKKSQHVILKLNDYPYREYGVIEGELNELNSIPGENFYLGKVSLNTKNKSTYGKHIELRENMTGICNIITNDRSVLGRVFEKVTYVFYKR